MSDIRTSGHGFKNLLKYQTYVSVRNSVTFFEANTEIPGRRALNFREIIASLAIASERIMRAGDDHFTGPGTGQKMNGMV
jgi:hypothetical protein